ncbi:ecotin [Desulfopila aestuarii]|uniref:Ecotin n=1 Tax=Desulfopila aestuarii DSM 18488 TaxID=1121416 RepID=A0A1M7YJD5_9BACT|nr:ecotin family protein [Desulfopila aestuarii]SHO52722.1 ecotin [Desulfopila aestuarii DSM 18488]
MNWNNRKNAAIKRPILLVMLLVLLSTSFTALADDNMKAFPQAEAGMVRHVLQLPAKDDETLYKVEVIVGKVVMVDGVNQYRFGGSIESEVIEGWGYTRYVVDKIGPMMGTMMAVDPNAPKVERFIAIGGEPYLIRYNSRLPVVVYVPEGCEVRYRIWSGGSEMLTMQKG